MTKPDAPKKVPGGLRPGQTAILIALPLAAATAALCVGRIAVTPSQLVRSILNKFGAGYESSSTVEAVLWSMRFPRILLALLTGAGLSVAGAVFQTLFANPLATPDTLGVASGASFGAALSILLGLNLVGIQTGAFAAGLAAVALTYLASRGCGESLTDMILGGIMVGSLFSALVSLVKFLADEESQLPAITYWLMGSLASAGYKSLLFGAPPILIGIAVLIALRWRLNLLALPEDEAKASGVNLAALRGAAVVCATAVTASCVSMCGQVGWVGLLIPHICRLRFGDNTTSLIPASALCGAAFMVAVDTVARSLSAAEIPISVLTALIGAPFFILILRRSGGIRR